MGEGGGDSCSGDLRCTNNDDNGMGMHHLLITIPYSSVLPTLQVKAILVNIFGGIVNCATIANGIIKACKDTKLALPLIVRLEGGCVHRLPCTTPTPQSTTCYHSNMFTCSTRVYLCTGLMHMYLCSMYITVCVLLGLRLG